MLFLLPKDPLINLPLLELLNLLLILTEINSRPPKPYQLLIVRIKHRSLEQQP